MKNCTPLLSFSVKYFSFCRFCSISLFPLFYLRAIGWLSRWLSCWPSCCPAGVEHGTRAKHYGSILAVHFVGPFCRCPKTPEHSPNLESGAVETLLIRHPAFPSLFLRRAPTLTLPTDAPHLPGPRSAVIEQPPPHPYKWQSHPLPRAVTRCAPRTQRYGLLVFVTLLLNAILHPDTLKEPSIVTAIDHTFISIKQNDIYLNITELQS